MRLLWLIALTLGASPADAQDLRSAPVEQSGPDALPDPWKPGRRSSRACFAANRIAGAVVIDPRTLDLSDRNGRRFRLYFADDCPHLGYYGGFYYRLGEDGMICARRDQLLGRSGSSCRIASIAELFRVRDKGR